MSTTGMKAIVQAIAHRSNRHGPYATAKVRGVKGLVTFSLRATVWQEGSVPKTKDVVFLDDVRQKASGEWRAHVARFWRPSDEHQQTKESLNKSAKTEKDKQ